MPTKRARLAPEQMSNPALYQRARTLVASVRFTRDYTPREREWALDELDAVLLELQLRGEQLRLV
jgi:hypothetical protein